MQFTGFMDIPSWYMEYKEFSDTLLHRNAWFIKIRYAAALLLTILISTLFVVASTANSIYLFMLALSPGALILLANIILDIKLKKHADSWDYRRLLNFALLQVITDLTAIAMLVYITGGVESVLSLLFVFHIIISALLFPARLVVWVSASVVAFYNTFAWLECSLLIPHFNLWLLLPTSLFNNPLYVLLNTVIFSGVICMSALLAYRIAADMISQQKALYDLYQKLELAESQKQQYVIAIVHEIKQPVTAVTSFLELVTQNVLGEVPKEIESVLQKCIARNKEAVVMINNILKVSKLRLMNQMQNEPVNLRDVIDTVRERYEPIIEKKKVQVKISLPEEIPEFSGDMFLITLALSNLFSNALKYNHESGSILITLLVESENIILAIADTGIGIPESELQKVSNDFFRASNLDGKSIEGAGVGLTVVRQIIENHNGTISIISPSGIGNTEFPGTRATLTFSITQAR